MTASLKCRRWWWSGAFLRGSHLFPSHYLIATQICCCSPSCKVVLIKMTRCLRPICPLFWGCLRRSCFFLITLSLGLPFEGLYPRMSLGSEQSVWILGWAR